MDAPSGTYEWDIFLSFRRTGYNKEEEIAERIYEELTRKGLRVFHVPRCLGEREDRHGRDWDRKYLKALANSLVVVLLITRETFTGREFDMKKYVWSSKQDELLMEWELVLELYDRGRTREILPCLIGDLTTLKKQKAMSRIVDRLGLKNLDERAMIARMRELFNYVDRDGSGFIDEEELLEAFTKFGVEISREELSERLQEVDDGNCKLDVFEFEDLLFAVLEDKAGIFFDGRREKGGRKKQQPPASSSCPEEDDDEEIFTNFEESRCMPPLPNITSLQSSRRVVSWLHTFLKYKEGVVLWRAPHCRPLPTVDNVEGGRTIRQTVDAIVGFKKYLVQGRKQVALQFLDKYVYDEFVSSINLSRVEGEDAASSLAAMTGRSRCAVTGQRASLRDPITSQLVRDMKVLKIIRKQYFFNSKSCSPSVLVEEDGTRITCAGSGGESVLLDPPIASSGVSYVDLQLQNIGQVPYMYVGICSPIVNSTGEWSALLDESSKLLALQDGSKLEGGERQAFLHIKVKAYDRVSVLVDMDKETCEIFLNDKFLGVLCTRIDRPSYFVVTLGWPRQRVEIMRKQYLLTLAKQVRSPFLALSKEEVQEKIRSIFLRGSVSLHHSMTYEALRELLSLQFGVQLSNLELRDVISEVDSDRDGNISLDEFEAFILYLSSL
mmetsp:Transcript_41849/g.131963  ORF Transcript_41849/g.131963 Transcript_41849/m.131963 type:complete len:666 (-) Transcript_41849:47-2044(-)